MIENNKIENIKTIKACFSLILKGDRETSHLAARKVRKLLYSSQINKNKFKEIENIVDKAANIYAKISEEWRQENFVMAVSVIYFLRGRKKEPDFLFPWLFDLLWHKNGNIRYAAVRMIERELGPLTFHIRPPKEKPISKNADQILFNLFVSLNFLLAESWKPGYKKYKYISSLPSGTYKSGQIILNHLEEDCGEEYTKSMENLLKSLQKQHRDR